MRWRRACAWLVLLMGTFAPLAAGAAALQISPIRLDLLPGQSAGSLTLRNRGTQPLNAQVRVFRWTQDAEGDRLEPAPALVASPPIVQISGEGEQLVRVVLTQPAAGNDEQTYRLLIDELPERRPQAQTGVTMQLRYSVPVFVNASTGAPPRPGRAAARWRADPAGGSQSGSASRAARRRVDRMERWDAQPADRGPARLCPGRRDARLAGGRRARGPRRATAVAGPGQRCRG